MISFNVTGSFKKTESFFKKASTPHILAVLNSCGQEGVDALSSATPIESGLAADSWSFKASGGRGKYRIVWLNNDVENGFPVAIMLQYGYGTGTGGYVQGKDYINPAMRPVFDRIADKVWKVVTSA
jgi:hypothetical protein